MTRAIDRTTGRPEWVANSRRGSQLVRRAWTEPRAVTLRQLTHAVEPGHTVALCGARTSEQGGAWTAPGTDGVPVTRCQVCAAAVQYLARRTPTRT